MICRDLDARLVWRAGAWLRRRRFDRFRRVQAAPTGPDGTDGEEQGRPLQHSVDIVDGLGRHR